MALSVGLDISFDDMQDRKEIQERPEEVSSMKLR
jgi:hypothetical protein